LEYELVGLAGRSVELRRAEKKCVGILAKLAERKRLRLRRRSSGIVFQLQGAATAHVAAMAMARLSRWAFVLDDESVKKCNIGNEFYGSPSAAGTTGSGSIWPRDRRALVANGEKRPASMWRRHYTSLKGPADGDELSSGEKWRRSSGH